jgi:hypothetical protein
MSSPDALQRAIKLLGTWSGSDKVENSHFLSGRKAKKWRNVFFSRRSCLSATAARSPRGPSLSSLRRAQTLLRASPSCRRFCPSLACCPFLDFVRFCFFFILLVRSLFTFAAGDSGASCPSSSSGANCRASLADRTRRARLFF